MIDLKEGDVILYDLVGFIPKVISFFTKSEWNHVGLVGRDNSGRLNIFEANANKNKVTATGGYGYYKYKSIKILSAPKLSTSMKNILNNELDSHMGTKYEHSIVQFLKFVIPGLKNVNRTKDMLYCSELVKIVFKEVGNIHGATPEHKTNTYSAFDKVISADMAVAPSDFDDCNSPVYRTLVHLCGYTDTEL